MAFEGFGLRGAERHGAATYVAYVTASQELVRVMLGTEPTPEAPELEELDRSQDDILQGDANLLAQLPIANALTNLNSQLRVRLLLEQALSQAQRELSLVVDNEVRAALLGRTVNTRDQAEPQCLAREGAGDWLRALPCKALRLHLAKQEFVFMVKYCLGLPLVLSTRECPTRGCCTEADNLGNHSLSRGIGVTTTCKPPSSRRPTRLAWRQCRSRRGSLQAPMKGLPTSSSGGGRQDMTPASMSGPPTPARQPPSRGAQQMGI